MHARVIEYPNEGIALYNACLSEVLRVERQISAMPEWSTSAAKG